jgi:hypothetical protein
VSWVFLDPEDIVDSVSDNFEVGVLVGEEEIAFVVIIEEMEVEASFLELHEREDWLSTARYVQDVLKRVLMTLRVR